MKLIYLVLIVFLFTNHATKAYAKLSPNHQILKLSDLSYKFINLEVISSSNFELSQNHSPKLLKLEHIIEKKISGTNSWFYIPLPKFNKEGIRFLLSITLKS